METRVDSASESAKGQKQDRNDNINQICVLEGVGEVEIWGKTVPKLIDLWMGLFRGAVFRHGGGARKQRIKHQTEMPTSTMALMGRFPSLMGRFPTLMGRFPDFVLRGRFTSWKSTGKQPIKRRGVKMFLKNAVFLGKFHDNKVGKMYKFHRERGNRALVIVL